MKRAESVIGDAKASQNNVLKQPFTQVEQTDLFQVSRSGKENSISEHSGFIPED